MTVTLTHDCNVTIDCDFSVEGNWFLRDGTTEINVEPTITGKTIVATTLTTNNNDITTGDFTLPNGATFAPGTTDIKPSGDVYMASGIVGLNALDLDGSEYVTISHNAALNPANITIEALVKTIDTSIQLIVEKRDGGSDGYNLAILNQHVFMRINGNTAEGTIDIVDGKWHHIVGVYDGADIKLYVDRRLDGNVNIGVSAISTTSPMYIGYTALSSNPFTGQIGMVRVFSDARTQSELSADALNSFVNMSDTGNLVAMYQFDEGTGTAIDNVEGTAALDGTASASTVWAVAGTYSGASATITPTGAGTHNIYAKGNTLNFGAFTGQKFQNIWTGLSGIFNFVAGTGIEFADAAGAGWTDGTNDSTGVVNFAGTTGSHCTVASESATPANKWANPATLMWDTTTFTDIVNAVVGLPIASGHTPTDLSDITVDKCTTGVRAYGTFSAIDNIEITNCTTDVLTDSTKTLTFVDSNFASAKVTANGGVISKNHNDVANTWYTWGTVNSNSTALIPLSDSSVVVKEGDLAFGSSMHNNQVKDITVEDSSGTISADLDVTVWFKDYFNHDFSSYGTYLSGTAYGIIIKGVPIPFTAWNIGEIKNGKEVKNYGEIWNLPEIMVEGA